MSHPEISVLMSVYNGERYVEESIDSVLNQSFVDFELIVINDGSTDETAQCIERAHKGDSRVIVTHQPRQGLGKALNCAASRARGKYLARQDADDVSHADRLALQVLFLEENPTLGAVGTGSDVLNEHDQVIGRLSVPHGTNQVERGLLSLRATPVHGSMMMRRRVFEELNGYRAAFHLAQDYDLWLRMVERAPLDNVPEQLYQWRLGDNQSAYRRRREQQLKDAGIARTFAHERSLFGKDSYGLLEHVGEDLDAFARVYRLRGRLHAIWGELLLRGLANRPLARNQLTQAVRHGDRRSRTIGMLLWTALGLPWPGANLYRKPPESPGSARRRLRIPD